MPQAKGPAASRQSMALFYHAWNHLQRIRQNKLARLPSIGGGKGEKNKAPGLNSRGLGSLRLSFFCWAGVIGVFEDDLCHIQQHIDL